MKRYSYEALTQEGTVTRGEISANGELDAVEQLSQRGLEPYDVTPLASSFLEGLR